MNIRKAVVPAVCLLAVAGSLLAQHSVDPGRMYQRVYAIVPMVGSGTWDDPKRPLGAPAPHQITPGVRTGIIAFNHVESDDGKYALVEIVAANRQELAAITSPLQAQLSQLPATAAVGGVTPQLFDQSTASQSTVETAFKKLKRNFDITKFRVVVP